LDLSSPISLDSDCSPFLWMSTSRCSSSIRAACLLILELHSPRLACSVSKLRLSFSTSNFLALISFSKEFYDCSPFLWMSTSRCSSSIWAACLLILELHSLRLACSISRLCLSFSTSKFLALISFSKELYDCFRCSRPLLESFASSISLLCSAAYCI